ncbi:hypothetical protein [Ferrovibrio sp.]|uniref:hypothetical protein n=1 Tax=Ferrovibrio sp. TaxID=1917215 RepID=UPI0035AEF060
MQASVLHDWLLALENSGLGQTMRQSLVLYPVVEVLHILGFILLFAGIALFDLRLLGLARGLPLAQLARICLPMAGGGLLLAISMGLLLFSTEASHLAANPAFQIKLLLILLGLLNVAAFHWGWRGSQGQWREPTLPARAGAAASLAIWTSVVIFGRLIAYV